MSKGKGNVIPRGVKGLKTELEKAPRLATEMYRMGEAEWGEDSSKTLKRAQLAIGGLTTKTKPYYSPA